MGELHATSFYRAAGSRKCCAVAMLIWLSLAAVEDSVCASDAAKVGPLGYRLAESKARLKAGDMTLRPALEALVKEAEEALKLAPPSVTQKKAAPPGGDLHDYTSFGPYWWPDPKKKDGLPYTRRDGQRNPAVDGDASDHRRFAAMRGAVETLAWAWHFTGEEKYAEHAAKLLRVWFLDAETRMNPNMNFAQAIPGITAGRGVGTIDFASLPQLVLAVELLVPSRAWTEKDYAALKAWFGELVDWMVASRNGKDAAGASNNIATWCDVQVVSYALFSRKVDVARERLEAAKTRRIAAQISPDGRQQEELKRTRSLDYSTGNLAGLLQLAALGKSCDIDLLNYKTKDGRSIRAALDYLMPYADASKKWPHKQITPVRPERLREVIVQAATLYDDPALFAIADKVAGKTEAAEDWRVRLLYNR